MLDAETRTAIFRLHRKGHGYRTIARALGISRNSVKKVVKSGVQEVLRQERAEKAAPHIERIRELYAECKGNLVRVHEELEAEGITIAYTTLTGFCRRHEIGEVKKKAAGRYHFSPGEEMQHDTSPHDVVVGGRRRRLQCASVVLCFSRMIYAQAYPTFNRFYAKIFLTEAVQFFGGAAKQCMVDNTNIVVLRGTGADAIIVDEMEAFADRFGYTFIAHEKGDKNRSARVERPFHYIENNFYAGRTFADLKDLNLQFIEWCEKVNRKYKPNIHAVPRELFQAERPTLKPLPLHIPEVYQPHSRIVDVEGYISLHTNRYSVPVAMRDRRVSVLENKDKVRIYLGTHHLITEHERGEEGARKRFTLPEHKRQKGRWRSKELPLPEEKVLRAASPEMAQMVDMLIKKYGARSTRRIRRLHKMYLNYSTDIINKSLEQALQYGLADLDRIERMILRNIAGDIFRINRDSTTLNEEDYGR